MCQGLDRRHATCRSPPSSAWPARADRSQHGRATGEALSAIDPEYIGVLTLMLTPGTAMDAGSRRDEVRLPDSLGMLRELREIVAHTNVSDCLFRSNHASNYLPLGGRLPRDKAAMFVPWMTSWRRRDLRAGDCEAVKPAGLPGPGSMGGRRAVGARPARAGPRRLNQPPTSRRRR